MLPPTILGLCTEKCCFIGTRFSHFDRIWLSSIKQFNVCLACTFQTGLFLSYVVSRQRALQLFCFFFSNILKDQLFRAVLDETCRSFTNDLLGFMDFERWGSHQILASVMLSKFKGRLFGLVWRSVKSLWIIHRWDDVNYENCALQDLFVEKGSICSKLKKSNKLFCVKTQYRAVTLLIQTCWIYKLF